VDWCLINPLNVLSWPVTGSIHFHDKLDLFHILISPDKKRVESGESQVIQLFRDYRVEIVATPHSRQRDFIDVINPQAGHILCDRAPVICGISLRIHRNSRVMTSMASRL